MADAGSLSCPRCGAPASPEGGPCPYCSTPLALVACPSCLARIFRGLQHCPHCGSRVVRREDAESPHQCPRCHEALGTVSVGETRLEECNECAGVWLDAASFEQLCESRQDQAALLGREAVDPAPGPPLAGPAYLPCPVCHKLMLRFNFAKRSGIVVALCRQHGVWCDSDQLRQIVKFIGAGGYLDESLERQRERLEHERRLLQQKLYEQGDVADKRLLPEPPHVDVAAIVESARKLLRLLAQRKGS